MVDGEPDQEQYDGRQDVFAVAAGRRVGVHVAIHATAGINAWLTTYSESVDFCRRVCLSGGRVVVVPQAEISHRRARYEGICTRGGEPLKDDHTVNHAMTVHRSQQRYLYNGPGHVVLVYRLAVEAAPQFCMAISMMFGKKPYEAWVQLCLPWLAFGRYRGKHEITQSGGQTIEGRRIVPYVLFADSQQIKQFHDRRDAFQSQQGRVLLSPLERAHLRDTHHISLECGRGDGAGVLCGHRGDVLAGVPSDILRRIVVFRCVASHRCQLHATGAVRHHAVGVWQRHRHSCAAHAVAAGADAGSSLVTLGHVTAALAMIIVCGRAAERIVVLGAGGRIHPPDVVRALGGLLWASTGIMFGWYAQANMPMLTVMVFLPAAFAFVFRAVGMYHTEDPLAAHIQFRPRPSPHCASSLWWLLEPQLLSALIVVS